MAENLQPGPSSSSADQHAPYAPTISSLGGIPTVGLDVPISAVFLCLFIGGAVSHMAIFQLNKRKGHKFIMSGMLFGFCMSRIAACVLRIVWATRPMHVPLAIAAMIFVSAGVILLFVINIIFAQRIMRASHPDIGWAKTTSILFKIYYASIIVSLIALITCTIQSFYTLNKNTKRIDRDVQLYGATYFAVSAFFPIPFVGILLFTHRLARRKDPNRRFERFGSGHLRTKIFILQLASVILCLGASFRAGTNYLAPHPRSDPAWYQSKACFYLFDFTVEIIVVYMYVIMRVDQRFHIPNGSHKRGDYEREFMVETEKPQRQPRIVSEEEMFDNEPEDSNDYPDSSPERLNKPEDVEAGAQTRA
ncbi:MAG: hypothetical protein M1827_002484 [Pycnora praestabilis]|nr:MAG: hypothetical protein M1827_002484 [Pycnora praestabilis]